MKIQIASDLHFEMIADPAFIGFAPALGADVLVLAGDIGVGTRGIERFLDWPVPVVYVAGNHEFYGCEDIGRRMADLRAVCARSAVHFLEKDVVVIDGVRFLGSTLWTDYELLSDNKSSIASVMAICNRFMSDHGQIRTQGRALTAMDVKHRHAASQVWLAAQIAAPFTGKTVVVTHHAPHPLSMGTDVWTKPDVLRAAYASDLSRMFSDADITWFHGHLHRCVDYSIRGTRVCANPRGYPVKDGFQNKSFDAQVLVTV